MDVNTPVFWPMLAQVALIACVWVRMYLLRIAEMKSRRIHPQKLALSQPKGNLLEDTRAADNFNNLFEVPVLFFIVCLVMLVTGIESLPLLLLAWGYVLLRSLHSLIQTTYNKVLHRFSVYVASTLVVFALWAGVAIELLT